jgi:hypothetical protein
MSQLFLHMPDVPDSTKALLTRLLQEQLLPLETLRKAIESYRAIIHETKRKNGKANVDLGDRIADALHLILRRVNEATGDENQRILQAAVRYFIIQNDGNGHDLESAQGLVDDARVVNAVLRYFGRDDLMIRDLPEPPVRNPPTRGGAAAPGKR